MNKGTADWKYSCLYKHSSQAWKSLCSLSRMFRLRALFWPHLQHLFAVCWLWLITAQIISFLFFYFFYFFYFGTLCQHTFSSMTFFVFTIHLLFLFHLGCRQRRLAAAKLNLDILLSFEWNFKRMFVKKTFVKLVYRTACVIFNCQLLI